MRKDRRAPEPEEEKAVLVHDEDGGARIVPGGNIVEGAIEDDDEVAPLVPPQREAVGRGTARRVVEG